MANLQEGIDKLVAESQNEKPINVPSGKGVKPVRIGSTSPKPEKPTAQPQPTPQKKLRPFSDREKEEIQEIMNEAWQQNPYADDYEDEWERQTKLLEKHGYKYPHDHVRGFDIRDGKYMLEVGDGDEEEWEEWLTDREDKVDDAYMSPNEKARRKNLQDYNVAETLRWHNEHNPPQEKPEPSIDKFKEKYGVGADETADDVAFLIEENLGIRNNRGVEIQNGDAIWVGFENETDKKKAIDYLKSVGYNVEDTTGSGSIEIQVRPGTSGNNTKQTREYTAEDLESYLNGIDPDLLEGKITKEELADDFLNFVDNYEETQDINKNVDKEELANKIEELINSKFKYLSSSLETKGKENNPRDLMKEWDPDEFQTDLIRNDISLEEIWEEMKNGKDFYEIASVNGEGFDSDVREKIFSMIFFSS